MAQPIKRVRPAEVRKAFRATRKAIAESLARLDAGDLDGAYAAAERAQHSAYDAKDLIVSGGRYESPEQVAERYREDAAQRVADALAPRP